MAGVISSMGSGNFYRPLSEVYCFFTVSRVLRALQLIFASVVAGLYGIDLAHFTNINAHADAEWVYAEFVATVSAITCLIFSLKASIHVVWSVLDATIFVLWLAQVGVFGSIFYPTVRSGYAESTLSVSRMRAAVWIDLANLVLWLLTAVLRIAWFIQARKQSRRSKASKGVTPFLLFVGRGSNSHIYSDQEHGCLDIGQEALIGPDTTNSEKSWANMIDIEKSKKIGI